jgi:hypothetical protein
LPENNTATGFGLGLRGFDGVRSYA